MPQTNVVVQERSVGTTPAGKSVVKEKTEVSSPREESVAMVTRLVYFIIGALEVLLGFRFILRLLGANPASGFVSFTYSLSAIFVYPFYGIFHGGVVPGNETVGVLEPATLVAMLVYLVIAVGVIELVKIVTKTDDEE